jgi:hypothetical protein
VTPLAGRDVALQISLDRPDPDVNDAMRAPQNFRKMVTAIPALVERGITVRIATTVESITDAELDGSCAVNVGAPPAAPDAAPEAISWPGVPSERRARPA